MALYRLLGGTHQQDGQTYWMPRGDQVRKVVPNEHRDRRGFQVYGATRYDDPVYPGYFAVRRQGEPPVVLVESDQDLVTIAPDRFERWTGPVPE